MLSVRDLCFSYVPDQPVLRGITLDCPAGITAVIGPNAAGKSTLVRLMAGLLTPQAGSVELDTRPIATISPPDRARSLAYIAQRTTLSAAFSVREAVSLGRYALPADTSAIDSALRRAEIAELAVRRFAELSVGQQQRVALARAIAQLHPVGPGKVLIADEPIAAMDPAHALSTAALLRALASEGLAIVVVLHDLTIAARLADRVALLASDGTLAAHAPPAGALRPELLRAVFQAEFSRTQTAAGPVLVADARVGDTSDSAARL